MPFGIGLGRECGVRTGTMYPVRRAAIDPNRSITEWKSGRSTPAFCGREVLHSLEGMSQAAANRGSSSARRLVSASKSATWPRAFNRPAR